MSVSTLRVVLFFCLISAFSLITGCSGCSGSGPAQPSGPPAAGPTDIPTPDLGSRPYGLCQRLLEDLRSHNLKDAYGMFCARYQQGEAYFSFEAVMSNYLKDPAQKALLDTATTLEERVKGDWGLTLVGAGERERWKLVWKREQSGWKLQSAEGGPFGGPDLEQGSYPAL